VSDNWAANLHGDKTSLRAAVRLARRTWREAASDAQVAERAERIAHTVCTDSSVRAACADRRVITCFASLPTEPPTWRLLNHLVAYGADVLLPIVQPNRTLHWARYESSTSLAPASLAIPEPTGAPIATGWRELLDLNPAVMIVPALAVDRTGTRLGQGGGYYDTVLEHMPSASEGGPEVIALVGADEVLDSGTIPRDAHDRPVDRWITG
jgi:5-formyltetrahydrofolate cyclo-ligase